MLHGHLCLYSIKKHLRPALGMTCQTDSFISVVTLETYMKSCGNCYSELIHISWFPVYAHHKEEEEK